MVSTWPDYSLGVCKLCSVPQSVDGERDSVYHLYSQPQNVCLFHTPLTICLQPLLYSTVAALCTCLCVSGIECVGTATMYIVCGSRVWEGK